jgi:hypothetical protein
MRLSARRSVRIVPCDAGGVVGAELVVVLLRGAPLPGRIGAVIALEEMRIGWATKCVKVV